MSVEGGFSTISEMFDAVTERFAEDARPVLMHKVDGAYRGISYAALKRLVEECALGLASLGVRRGDNVALVAESRPEWIVADLAMTKLGAVNVPVYPTLSAKQTEYILNDAQVSCVICSNQYQLAKVRRVAGSLPQLRTIIVISDAGGDAAASRGLAPISFASLLEQGGRFGAAHPGYLVNAVSPVRPEDVLTIIYTSGTTGEPKGVVLTHANLVSNINASASCIPFTHADIVLSFLPLCHSYERMGAYYTAMSRGATIAFAESIEALRDNFLEVRPTVVTTVPRLLERMESRLRTQVEESPPLKRRIFSWALAAGKAHARARRTGRIAPVTSLRRAIADRLVFSKIRARTGGRMRFFVSGGAALAPELGEFFEALGIRVIEGYGMTECSPVISVNRIDDVRFGTVGKPIPGVHVRIAGDGEILVRGPNVMRGYWNDRASTAGIIDEGGWLHTGDIGTIDDDGFIHITDRKKHLFVSSGGKNIAPQPIENLFLRSPLVDQAVLIGDGRTYLTALIVPNFALLEEFTKAHGIPKAEETTHPDVIRLFEKELTPLQRDLAGYERVRKFTLLDHPLTIEEGEITPTMKVRRKAVEERYRSIIEKMYEGEK